MKGWRDSVGIKDVVGGGAEQCGEEKLPSLCITAVQEERNMESGLPGQRGDEEKRSRPTVHPPASPEHLQVCSSVGVEKR